VEEIKHNGEVLALIVNEREFPNGIRFWGDDSKPLQFGSCVYDSGVVLQPHIHKVRERIAEHKTIELLYMIRGGMRVTLYNDNRKAVAGRILSTGDCILLYAGGHGFRVIADDTVFIEAKNGPYVSVEADKEKFDDSSV